MKTTVRRLLYLPAYVVYVREHSVLIQGIHIHLVINNNYFRKNVNRWDYIYLIDRDSLHISEDDIRHHNRYTLKNNTRVLILWRATIYING